MLPIDSKICSFLPSASENDSRNQLEINPVVQMDYFSVNDIRAHSGYPVDSFHKLVALTGLIALRNRRYDLFFRGQSHDYRDSNGRTIIYPSICRPAKDETRIYTSTINERYQRLCQLTLYLRKQQYRERFDEYYHALIQHYELLPTPLVDVTQSLRVAATFALRNSPTGYLFVLGLPYPQGSISHFVDQNMVLVKLLHVCPSNAKRPRYQEGFLVGRLPFNATKQAGDNLAIRLCGKLLLTNESGSFWDDDFPLIPDKLLFPPNDKYKFWLDVIKKSY